MASLPYCHFPVRWEYSTPTGFPITFVATTAAANSDCTLARCELCLYDCILGCYSVFDTRLLFPSAPHALDFVDYDFVIHGPLHVPNSVSWMGIFYKDSADVEIKNIHCCIPLPRLLREEEEEIST